MKRLGQTTDLPGSSLAMQDAFLGCACQLGRGGGEGPRGRLDIVFGDGGPEGLDRALDGGADVPIPDTPLETLFVTLDAGFQPLSQFEPPETIESLR